MIQQPKKTDISESCSSNIMGPKLKFFNFFFCLYEYSLHHIDVYHHLKNSPMHLLLTRWRICNFCVFCSSDLVNVFDIVCCIVCLCISIVLSLPNVVNIASALCFSCNIFVISCIFMFLCVSTLPAVFLCFL